MFHPARIASCILIFAMHCAPISAVASDDGPTAATRLSHGAAPEAKAVPKAEHAVDSVAAPKVARDSPPAKAAPKEIDPHEPAPPARQPSAKTGASATPQEVAERIATKLAALRTEQAERRLQEPLRPRPTPVRRRIVPPPATELALQPPRHADASGAPHRDVHWSYGGEGGPIRWAEMNPEWAKCGSGNRQSPIDIRSGIKVDLEPITFDYKPAGFSIIDNGHTVQVNLGPGNHITVSGRMFELVQFHFHRPSEERVNGRSYEMVAHLVHKDSAGKLAVVAVLIERGAARNLVQTIWNNLPLEKNEAVTPIGALDMNDILPVKREYFTYMGSLTTPPCSEGVLWMVMKQPVSLSQDQLDIFSRLYQMNARPIQLGAERLIKESN